MQRMAYGYEQRTLKHILDPESPVKKQYSPRENMRNRLNQIKYFQDHDLQPEILRHFRNASVKAAADMKDILRVRARAVVHEYMSNTRDKYNICYKFKHFFYDRLIPIQKRVRDTFNVRKGIYDYINQTIENSR